MNDVEKISIYLHKETVEKIKKIVMFENLKNEMYPLRSRPTNFEISDFITGCLNKKLNELENFYQLAGLDDLGKPYRLKNRFKEILSKKGIKQKELAAITQIDDGNISIILSNRSQPSLDYFLRIWIALGCLPFEKVLYRTEE